MGDPRGFLKVRRQEGVYRPVCERCADYDEVLLMRSEEDSAEQASRCMDCGTPFCHWGCPVGNYIPEWNDLMFGGYWKEAWDLLDATNNLPEITGRVCPATCEYSCVLGINDDPVTIRENELAIVEHAFKNGFPEDRPPARTTGKKAAVIGSGPAGISCADQLNRAGHEVVVFEKDKRPGGILRYGIPDFKLEKWLIDRRVDLLRQRGVDFITSAHIGSRVDFKKIYGEFDALCFACGSGKPRDLDIEGRGLAGIHFAMDYLTRSNRRVSGEKISEKDIIDAAGKKVVVIGGGDTGADCVGTAHRQGASCVVQIEVLPKPEECRTGDYPWPMYPMLLKTTSSHEEGGDRHWSVLTKSFEGEKGRVKKLKCVKVEFEKGAPGTCPVMKEAPSSGFDIEADLVILAIGFLHPVHEGLVSISGVELDGKGNVRTGEDHGTSLDKVFSAGDMRRGQSLIVWAVSEGRRAAYHMDRFLSGKSNLPCI